MARRRVHAMTALAESGIGRNRGLSANAARVTRSDPLVVALVTVPESSPFALYGLAEVLGAVGVAWTQLTGEPTTAPRFEVRLVGADRLAFTGTTGMPLRATHGFDELAAADIALVPDLAIDPAADPRGRWSDACRWLRRMADAGALVGSVCSGSVMLAEAGLLDGLEATTHWAFAPVFARHYPAVRLRPERILQASGPEQRIVTGGGAAAWEDLALWLVARRGGEEEARRIARIFLFGDRSEGQLPFAALVPRPAHEDRLVADAQAWIAEHYPERHAVAGAAAAAGLPERTFHRRFKRATGYSPVAYVQVVRIEEAKQLLERSALGPDEIAAEVGYEDPSHFRRVFRKLVGVTPARYRQRWRPFAAREPAAVRRTVA
jgi:transcriptional regulator GlxA family with amidase domain